MMLYSAAAAISEAQKEIPSSRNQFCWLIFTGIFGGATASTKYTMLPMVALVGILLAIFLLKQSFVKKTENIPTQKTIFHLVTCAVLICIVFSPWLIKNIINTGNPVYPAAYEKFGNEKTEWTVSHQKAFTDLSKRKGFHRHYEDAQKNKEYGKAKILILASIIDSAFYHAQNRQVEVFGEKDWAGYEDQFQGLHYVFLLPLFFLAIFFNRKNNSNTILLFTSWNLYQLLAALVSRLSKQSLSDTTIPSACNFFWLELAFINISLEIIEPNIYQFKFC